MVLTVVVVGVAWHQLGEERMERLGCRQDHCHCCARLVTGLWVWLGRLVTGKTSGT